MNLQALRTKLISYLNFGHLHSEIKFDQIVKDFALFLGEESEDKLLDDKNAYSDFILNTGKINVKSNVVEFNWQFLHPLPVSGKLELNHVGLIQIKRINYPK